MPAVRSPKGKGKEQKEAVDPCEICGVVLSRKSDLKRHAKRPASDDEQQSNLDTHIRRLAQESIHCCTDDRECKFNSCDPAALLRHRKRYIPRSPAGLKFYFAEASTWASSSSRPMSTPPSPSPSPSLSVSLSPPPVASESSSQQPPPGRSSGLRSYSPTYSSSSGESEASPFTPITSPPTHRESPQAEGLSPTVLAMFSSSVHVGTTMMNPHHSLLFAPASNDCYNTWPGVDPSQTFTSPALLDASSFFSSGSGTCGYFQVDQDQHRMEVAPDEGIADEPQAKLWHQYDHSSHHYHPHSSSSSPPSPLGLFKQKIPTTTTRAYPFGHNQSHLQLNYYLPSMMLVAVWDSMGQLMVTTKTIMVLLIMVYVGVEDRDGWET